MPGAAQPRAACRGNLAHAVSAAIEQLLLEAAIQPSEGRPRQLIIDTVAWLLLDEADDLEIEAEAERVH